LSQKNWINGPRAEHYGYVNRVIADDRLDAEVEAVASELTERGNGGQNS